MAHRGWLLWSALPVLAAGALPSPAALAESDATALLQSWKDVDPATTYLHALSRSMQQQSPPQISPTNYWMFNYGRNRNKNMVEKTVIEMNNYTASARAFPDAIFSPAAIFMNTNTSSKKIMGELKGAFTNLKKHLSDHQKNLHHMLYQVHVNLPLSLQPTDSAFQDQWTKAYRDVINSVNRFRNYVNVLNTPDKVCPKSAEFVDDLNKQTTNFTRFMDSAAAVLPPPLPDGNGFINSTALEARRSLYADSKSMMLRMEDGVSSSLALFLNRTLGCELSGSLAWSPSVALPAAAAQLGRQMGVGAQMLGVAAGLGVAAMLTETPPPQQGAGQSAVKREKPWPELEPYPNDTAVDLHQDVEEEEPTAAPQLAEEYELRSGVAGRRVVGAWLLAAAALLGGSSRC